VSKEIPTQGFGTLAPTRIGLSAEVRHKSVAALNRMLAHTRIRDVERRVPRCNESQQIRNPSGILALERLET
jgi:hypothetical protein